MIIAFDMDGVVADLQTPWIEWNNKTFNDDLTYEKLQGYSMAQQSKGKGKVYEFIYRPDTYKIVLPRPGMLELIKTLRDDGHRPVIATKASHNGNMVEGKVDWFKRHKKLHGGAITDKEIVFLQDKSLIHADMLIDDDPRNLENFHGHKVLILHPYNENYTSETSGNWIRVATAAELEVELRELCVRSTTTTLQPLS